MKFDADMETVRIQINPEANDYKGKTRMLFHFKNEAGDIINIRIPEKAFKASLNTRVNNEVKRRITKLAKDLEQK